MGPLEWVQNMRIFVSHVDIYQALVSNQVDKMAHSVDVSIFPQEPQGLPSGFVNRVAMVAKLKAWHRLGYIISARVT